MQEEIQDIIVSKGIILEPLGVNDENGKGYKGGCWKIIMIIHQWLIWIILFDILKIFVVKE